MGLRLSPIQSIGNLLAPASEMAVAPPTAPQAQTGITGETPVSPLGQQANSLLNNPQASAFMMQLVTSLLGQQGIASSVGQGLGAVGRFEKGAADLATANEAEARRRAEADRDFALRQQAAARAGGGKPKSEIGDAKFYSRVDEIYAQLQEAAELNDGEIDFNALRGKATIAALQEFGQGDIAQYYQGLSEEDRRLLEIRIGQGGPAAWDLMKQQAQALDKTNETVGATTGGPTQPAAPATGSNDIVTPNVDIAVPGTNSPGTEPEDDSVGGQLRQLLQDLGKRKLNL